MRTNLDIYDIIFFVVRSFNSILFAFYMRKLIIEIVHNNWERLHICIVVMNTNWKYS
jgi:hypothetical protein